jgi:hypothetical protein
MTIKSKNAQDLMLLQLRYKALQEKIAEDQKNDDEEQNKPIIPLVSEHAASEVVENQSNDVVKNLLDFK